MKRLLQTTAVVVLLALPLRLYAQLVPVDGGDSIAAIPWADPAEIALSPFGISTHDGVPSPAPLEPTVNKKAFNFRGIGISVNNDGRIRDCVSTHNWTGAKLCYSDSRITDCDVFNNRDACLWVARDAGNCQSTGCHFYGSRIAVYNEGGWQYRSTSDTIADAIYGTLCDGQSKFVGAMSQHCYVRNFLLRGGWCEIIGSTINVQKEAKELFTFNVPGLPARTNLAGVEFVGDFGRIRNSQIILTNWIHPANTASGKAATGVIIAANDIQITNTDLIDSDGLDATIGIDITGKRKGIVIDCNVQGFDKPKERILRAKEPCEINATFHCHGHLPIVELCDGCTGKITFEVGP